MGYLDFKKEIYDVAVDLLNTRFICDTLLGGVIVSHPFTSYSVVSIGGDMVDITSGDGFERWVDYMSSEVLSGLDFFSICNIVNKPYRLFFLGCCLPYLDEVDIAVFFKNNWRGIEFPSRDSTFSTLELLDLFKNCPRNVLMSEEELEFYNSLPEYVTVYRGVSDTRYADKHGVSWTLDKSVAEWFANRFYKDNEYRKVYTLVVPKSRVVCYFDYESECIVDTFGLDLE